MNEIFEEQCIEIRKTILYAFHQLCEKEKIRYSLGYGTFLGAVRHGGMIPWDDDIDVLVSREDFEKLCSLYRANDCKDRYQFVSHRNHPEIKTKIGYFIDFDTITETAYKTSEYHGIHIDVYPVDVVPNGWLKRKLLFSERWILQKLIRAKDLHPEVTHGKQRFIRRLVLVLCAPFGYDRALDRLHSVSMRYRTMPEEQKKEACILVESGTPVCFPYKVTKTFGTYPYDNHRYWGYKDFDTILKAWYGDYMTPPPADEQRRPEHTFVHFYIKDGKE